MVDQEIEILKILNKNNNEQIKANNNDLNFFPYLKTYNYIEAKLIFKKLILIMENLHSKGIIIHRDIKPENILLFKGNPIIMDFGFAYLTNINNLNDYCDSPGYMAPEIKLEKQHNNKVSIWSLGKTFHYRLFGQSYDPKDKNFNMFYNINLPSNDVKFLKPLYPKEISIISKYATDLLDKILTINPKDRQTCTE